MSGLNKIFRAASWLSAGIVDDDWSHGPRPPGRATVHSSGPSPFRVLLFGGGPAVGYGVTSHDLALAGQLTRRLSDLIPSGIDTHVVTDVDLRCRDMPRLLADVDVDRYDLVLLCVGVQDVLDFADAAEWAEEVRALTGLLAPTCGGRVPVCLIGVPPVSRVLQVEMHLVRVLDRRAEQFNARLQALCDEDPMMTFVRFDAATETLPGRHRTPATYGSWAEQIVPQITPVVRALQHFDHPHQAEAGRQAALERLNILDTPQEEAFDSITATARKFFRTVGAGISFIDHDRQWFKSVLGVSTTELPRAMGLCTYTIDTPYGFTIEDREFDPRFADNELVVAQDIRSYAGVPIRDPGGYAVGALCVFDHRPRSFTTQEMLFLRDLAHLAETLLSITDLKRSA